MALAGRSLPGQQPATTFRNQKEIGHRRPLWIREFKDAGVDEVRAGLKDGQWSDAKKIVAREWLESMDTAAWQAKRPEEAADKPKLRDKKWLMYILGAVALAFAARRMGWFG
jgi:hypothetical protein